MKNYKQLVDDKVFGGIIVVLDNKSNIVDANNEFLSLLGFTFNDISDKNIVDLIVPDEKSMFLDLTFINGVSNIMTLKFYHKSGAFRFFSFSIFNFDNYKLLIGNTLKKDFLAKKFEYTRKSNYNIDKVFENIEANNIRDLLSFEGNSLSLLLDLMPIEVWVKDKLGKYVFVNETYTVATKIKNEDCILKDDFQLFSKETAKSFIETDELARKSGKKISYNFETIDENLSSFAEVTKIPIYNNVGKYIGMLGFSVNTSYSKATEIMLQKEKDRLLFVLDNIEALVFEISSSYELLFVSGKLKKLLDFDMDNKEIMELFLKSPKTSEAREKLELALNGEKVIINAMIMEKQISFSLNPVKNNDGSYNIVGFGNTNGRDEK